MALSFQTFNTLVQNSVAAVQSACSTLLNLSPGSALLAILEANASVALWVQYLLALLFNRQRLATSTGADVDSFVNDFGMYRLAAVSAAGSVTFSRFTPTNSVTIPAGTIVISGDGTQQFATTVAVTIPAATLSGSAPAIAVTAGVGGNVAAGGITLLGQAIVGVDTVTNAAAFTGGQNAENDAACIARFPVYLASLVRCTPAAIMAVIASVQQGLTYYVQENTSTIGGYQPGNFVVTIDDGSGYPSTALCSIVYGVVNGYRPIGSTFAVQAPTVVSVNAVLTLTVAAGVVKANLVGPVATAITAYLNALPVGTVLPYSMIAAVAYGTAPGQITNVSAVTANGGTADINPGYTGVIKAATVTVN